MRDACNSASFSLPDNAPEHSLLNSNEILQSNVYSFKIPYIPFHLLFLEEQMSGTALSKLYEVLSFQNNFSILSSDVSQNVIILLGLLLLSNFTN